MKIYAGNENAEIRKDVLYGIFKLINQIVDDKKFKRKFFDREAKRSIHICVENYHNVALFTHSCFEIFKKLGVINFEEDQKAFKEFEDAGSKKLIEGYFQTKFESKKHLILQRIHSSFIYSNFHYS